MPSRGSCTSRKTCPPHPAARSSGASYGSGDKPRCSPPEKHKTSPDRSQQRTRPVAQDERPRHRRPASDDEFQQLGLGPVSPLEAASTIASPLSSYRRSLPTSRRVTGGEPSRSDAEGAWRVPDSESTRSVPVLLVHCCESRGQSDL